MTRIDQDTLSPCHMTVPFLGEGKGCRYRQIVALGLSGASGSGSGSARESTCELLRD